jgi:hypothetical protein
MGPYSPMRLAAYGGFVLIGELMWNMDIALVMGVVVTSTLTALLGLEMANNPPTKNWHRWTCRAAFGVLCLMNLTLAFLQTTRNLTEQARIQKAAVEQQGIQSQQYSAVKAKLDLIETLAKQAGTTPAQITAAFQNFSRQTLPAGALTNTELRDRAYDLISKMRALESDTARKYQELVDYWKDGVPDTPERRRTQEFEGLTLNEHFEFESKMLGEYIYLTQEIVNRLPEDKVPGEMSRRNAGTALWAYGMFTPQRNLPSAETRLADIASRLK